MFKLKSANSSFSVDNQKKAKEFYTNLLGLKVDENQMGLKLYLPEGGSVYVYQKDNHEPATFTILNLVVENIDQAVEELTKQGVSFERYEGFNQDEKNIARGISVGKGPDITWFKDPAGNILAVLQQS